MRERTETEKNYIWEKVYNQCKAGGYTHREARAQAYRVLDLLGPNTPQPMSATRWLEGKVTVHRWAA